MTKKYLILLFSLAITLSYSQEYYYWYKNEKVPLKINPAKHYLVLKSITSKTAAAADLDVTSSKIIRSGKLDIRNQLTALSSNTPTTNWFFVESTAINKKSSEIKYNAPFFITEDGVEAGLSHLFYVKLKAQKDMDILEKMSMENRVEIIGRNTYMPLWITLSCSDRSKGNALQMANLFYESGFFAAAEPDLMTDDQVNCTNDPLFNDQWGLNNTGQHGGSSVFDINYCAARQISTGDPDIVVAVLDEGVAMNHPDLNNMHPLSFNTETLTQPSQVLGNHGTAVAGIIGADADNNIGVAGIAPDCPIMSISNSFAGTPNSRIRRADGINFAVNNGADVINNSWGSGVQYQVIDDAIDNAFNNGRNGLGCVIVFATGNNNGGVSYPANSNNQILSVGAMSPCGERKNPSSCDGENWWGSNFGSTLDVVAPGVLIPTTDRPGGAGYTNNDYATFNGTSSAAPHVAGLAALILSVNPDLSGLEVNNIIEKTASKIGGYSYSTTSGRPNGRWNNEMGYGLINASAALQAASFRVNGSITFCPSATFSISPTPANGTNINWSVSPANAGTFSGNGANTTFTRNSGFSGNAAISAQVTGTNTVTINKNINVRGVVNFTWQGIGPYGQVDVNITSGSSPYKIYIGGVLVYSGSNSFVTVQASCNGGPIRVEANTPCGVASKSDIIPQGCASLSTPSMMVIHPNPSSTTLHVTQTDEFEGIRPNDPLGSLRLELYDHNGHQIKYIEYDSFNGESQMDIAGLKRDTYLLRIVGNGVDEVHRIIIE